MSIRLVVAKGSGPTGQLLREQLRAAGVEVVDAGGDALVSYGCNLQTQLPCLNAAAGRLDKLAQQRQLIAAGVPSIEVLSRDEALRLGAYPLLGRLAHHKAGRDIKLCLDEGAVRASGSEWFTPFVPSRGEYRCWVFRSAHLGSYRKAFKGAVAWRGRCGRNFHNGFAFELVRAADINREAVEAARKAVGALGLDFGAVDVLDGAVGGCKVLEVNTAPGVKGPRQVIVALAGKVANWEKRGYKGRREQP